MKSIRCNITSWITIVLVSAALTCSHAQTTPPPAADIVPKECLVISQVVQAGRSAIHRDAVEARIVAGTWKTPVAGETLTLPSGAAQTWTLLTAEKDGAFRGRGLNNGYACFTVNVDEPRRFSRVRASFSNETAIMRG